MTAKPPPTAYAWDARADVLRAGWLRKEGATKMSARFPSRRYCVLAPAMLEYYEEVQVPHRPGAAPGTLLVNEWNLVLHTTNHASELAVGDVIVAVDQASTQGKQAQAVLEEVAAPCSLTVLRPKGLIPLRGAAVQRLGKRHGGVAFRIDHSGGDSVPGAGASDGRRPFVLVAPDDDEAAAWLEAVRSETADSGRSPSGGGSLQLQTSTSTVCSSTTQASTE
tara:strand:- start:744 stop:1409 length:666 start_codon:yes stop_codon:yes gene_type:complete